MKSHPILFNGPMVRAILNGTKTQTRREVGLMRHPYGGLLSPDEVAEEWTGNTGAVACPYGQPGDRLWVREAFGFSCQDDDINERERVVVYQAGGYHVTDTGVDVLKRCQSGCMMQPNHHVRHPARWRPSIHMPCWASRITLEIVAVRVERLVSISKADAKAEGLTARSKDGTLIKYGIPDRDGLPGNDDDGWHWHEWEADPRNAYHRLWEKMNGPGSAVADPWVWVVEFRRVNP